MRAFILVVASREIRAHALENEMKNDFIARFVGGRREVMCTVVQSRRVCLAMRSLNKRLFIGSYTILTSWRGSTFVVAAAVVAAVELVAADVV